MPTYDVTHFFMLKHKTRPYRVTVDTENQALDAATKLLNADKTFNVDHCEVADDADPDWDNWDCDPEVVEVKEDGNPT